VLITGRGTSGRGGGASSSAALYAWAWGVDFDRALENGGLFTVLYSQINWDAEGRYGQLDLI